MFGYDMSWASFHVLEVMSSPKYLQKRVGYLAAAQSFRAETEVLMLATNLLKKVGFRKQKRHRLRYGGLYLNLGCRFILRHKSFTTASNIATHNHAFACHVVAQ